MHFFSKTILRDGSLPLHWSPITAEYQEKPPGFSPILSRLWHKFIIDFNDLLENTMIEILW